ncbi:type 4a pilus biogenesis protein PilO [Thermodesulforhabdus norvegica]|uniref:Type IV pilus assembly protein PilO n=1 Tax=Thermodesulforhabdus norvegica TaxID=39841 RepID=A0A1I4WCG1_9BACT|nr:type 4a pilus biogenesis protein PilO [Thermodesulforhabdus norvegica]SFN11115.1 type IV pilus assembly protein PilO [Thermodesulforhabdus norvegica]
MAEKVSPFVRIEESLKNLDNRRKVLIMVLTVALIVGGFWYFFYRDYDKTIKRLRQDVTSARQQLTRLKQASVKAKQLEEELAMAQRALDELLVALPELREIPGILQSVSEMGAKAGLEQLLFEPKNEEIKDFYSVIPVALDLRGSYHTIGLFYDQIAHFERVIRVRSFTLQRPKEGGNLLSVKCDIETYRYLGEQAAQQQTDESKESKKKGSKVKKR